MTTNKKENTLLGFYRQNLNQGRFALYTYEKLIGIKLLQYKNVCTALLILIKY